MRDASAPQAHGRATFVVVGDDHPLFRDGLANAIRAHAGLELAAPAGDSAAAVELALLHEPDVVLIDAEPGPVMRTLGRQRTRVVFLSAELEGGAVLGAVRAGAAGYLSKRDDSLAICAALTRVANGETVLSPAAQTALGAGVRAQRRPAGGLTSRELEILGLAADGLSTPEMAARLYLSRATVKTHLAHLFDKLGVRDRTAAVAVGLRRGMID